MYKRLLTAFAVLSLLGLSNNARSEPKYQIASAVVFPISFEGKATTPLTANTFVVLIPIADRVALIGKGGFASPFTTFQPAPQGQLGASLELTRRLRLGSTAIYRYIPHWDGTKSDAHVLGASLAPTIITLPNIPIAFPVGAAHNFTTQTWLGSAAIEVALPLPL